MSMASAKPGAQRLSVTVGHGLNWTKNGSRIRSIRKNNDTKSVSLTQRVRVVKARAEIGVREGDEARVDHIQHPDSNAGTYAGHVLLLMFDGKPAHENRHFFALSEVDPIPF